MINPEINLLDLILVSIAFLINFLMIFLFWARTRGHKQLESAAGMILIILAIPIQIISLLNFISGREWWTYILPIPMVIFLVIELFFDYMYELNFRKTKSLGVYLLFYYAGLFGLIGYTFLVNRTLGYALLAFYFIHQITALYAHKKK